MAADLRLIAICLAVSDACRDIVGDGRLRRRGFAPALTDAEVITMEIFAEMQGHHSDSAIWRYFDAHWRHFFPTLPTRSVFAKHCANLSMLKQMVQRVLYPAAADIHLTAYFHRFRPVVFIETGHRCSRKPASRFHDFGHPFSSRTAHVQGELSV